MYVSNVLHHIQYTQRHSLDASLPGRACFFFSFGCSRRCQNHNYDAPFGPPVDSFFFLFFFFITRNGLLKKTEFVIIENMQNGFVLLTPSRKIYHSKPAVYRQRRIHSKRYMRWRNREKIETQKGR